MSQKNHKAGYIAIVGRPNVGKSTLLNHMVGQKVSITSRKPQTTRHNILGIKTFQQTQLVFVDTPGVHLSYDKAINRAMNKSASSALNDVDVVIFVVDKTQWTEEDDRVLQQLQRLTTPIVVAVNKLDQIDNKNKLLPYVQKIASKLPQAEIIPVSALQGQNLDRLEQLLVDLLPEGEHFYPDDQVTDKSIRFMSAEIIREKITRQAGSELPYQVAVEIENFHEDADLITIEALILVERDGQKRIIIGEKGSKLKSIGSQARADIELLVSKKVMLKLWVKVKAGWSDSERALKSLGIFDQ